MCLEMRRLNAQNLIKAGNILTPGTDNYVGTAPEFRREPKPIWTEPGMGTIAAIEGLVELGMTPSQAIVVRLRMLDPEPASFVVVTRQSGNPLTQNVCGSRSGQLGVRFEL